MIFGNLMGDQAGHLFWAQKAIFAADFSEFVKWPIGPGTWQDLRSLNQETGYFYLAFKTMGKLALPFSDASTHALHTLLAAYLLNLFLSIVFVYFVARLFVGRWVSIVCALTTCVSLSWWVRSTGHLSLTAFYVLFGIIYLALGSPQWSLKRRLITGAIVGFLAGASYYYLYLGTILVGCILLALAGLHRWRRHRMPGLPDPVPYFKKGVWGVLAAVIVFGLCNTSIIRPGPRFGTLESLAFRGTHDLRVFSNRPSDFFKVHQDSPEHALLGLPVSTSMHGSNPTELSVFLGIGGTLMFICALVFGRIAFKRRLNLAQTVPVALLLIFSFALSISVVALLFFPLMPAVRVYSRIAIAVLPASVILVHLVLPHLTARRPWLKPAVYTLTLLLLLWPAWYAKVIFGSLVSFRPDQQQALEFVDRAKAAGTRFICVEFAQLRKCPLEFTDGFKLFLAAREGMGIAGVTIDGAKIFSDPAFGREAPQAWPADQCLKIPVEIYVGGYPGREHC